MHDFNAGGRALWDAITAEHELDAAQEVQLVEACRIKDRCDLLDEMARTGEDMLELVKLANASANQMKQLLAALRLPDATGKKPQYRGPRGAQAPSVPGGKVSGGAKDKASQSAAKRAASRWGA